MRVIENFRFNDVVLYSKGWYAHSGDFMKDLEKHIRQNEDYWYPEKMTDTDIMNYMLKALDIIYEHCTTEELKNRSLYHSHAAFLEKIKYDQHFYNISFEYAVCSLVYGILQGLTNEQIKLNRPKYNKKHRFGFGLWKEGNNPGMTYKEMNRRWDNR